MAIAARTMKIAKMTLSPQSALQDAATWEQDGFDAILSSETRHDPFVLSALAAARTHEVEIISNVVVAFARTPMLTAYSALDVQQLARGRFTLGLGSQIKPHIERRYGMTWSSPAARMKEYVQALHAIWDCWQHGGRLEFEGRFYRHSLMTPMFAPPAGEHGRPRIGIAAVGPEMTRVAAEVADILLCHSFTTPRYLREATLPLVESTLAAQGRDRARFRICGMALAAVGETDEALEPQVGRLRESLAFYMSTPAYRPVLESEGLESLQPELQALSREGRWQEMGRLVSDDVLHRFCVVGNARQVARALHDRYAGIYDLISCQTADGPGTTPLAVLRELRALAS